MAVEEWTSQRLHFQHDCSGTQTASGMGRSVLLIIVRQSIAVKVQCAAKVYLLVILRPNDGSIHVKYKYVRHDRINNTAYCGVRPSTYSILCTRHQNSSIEAAPIVSGPGLETVNVRCEP